MKHYELLIVLPGTMAEEEVAPVAEKVQKLLEDNGATNIVADDMGKSRMAYPMKHIRYGYFRAFRFDAEPAAIPEVQAKLRLFKELLRAMINTFDPAKREASAARLMKQRQESAMNTSKEEVKAEEPKKEESKEEEKPTEEKVAMEDIDKKLDELLETDLKSV